MSSADSAPQPRHVMPPSAHERHLRRDRTAIVAELGFDCAGAHPIVTLRNPAGLAGWTLPVLELLIVAGAVFALAHAIRRLRRDGDPTNLALWIASLVYLFVIEPPLYFPGWFGLDEPIGLMFSHNVFTVPFMFDRLPLYIGAFYPAMSQATARGQRPRGWSPAWRTVLAGALAPLGMVVGNAPSAVFGMSGSRPRSSTVPGHRADPDRPAGGRTTASVGCSTARR